MFFGSSKTKSRNLLRQEHREKRQQRGLSLEKSNRMTNDDRVGGWTTGLGLDYQNRKGAGVRVQAPKR